MNIKHSAGEVTKDNGADNASDDHQYAEIPPQKQTPAANETLKPKITKTDQLLNEQKTEEKMKSDPETAGDPDHTYHNTVDCKFYKGDSLSF